MTGRGAATLRLLAVERFGRLVLRRGELIERALYLGGVAAFIRLLQRVHRAFNRLPVGGAQLVAGIFQQPIGAVHRLVGAVAQLDFLATLLVLIGVRLGLS